MALRCGPPLTVSDCRCLLPSPCPTNPPSPPASPGTRTPPVRGPNIRALDGDRRADVVIIGGGFTGLSAAAHLAKSGANVALIEAHRFGDGASGRNGGQLGTGQRSLARGTGGRARLDPRQGAVRPRRGGQGASPRIRLGQRHRHRLHAGPALGRAQEALCRRLPQICRLHARARRLSAHHLHGRRRDRRAARLDALFRRHARHRHRPHPSAEAGHRHGAGGGGSRRASVREHQGDRHRHQPAARCG